ncbi:hypothetical protein [Brevibacillus migulae]|uniref:hypothetical protein n=1 Tax=Brevibacillus migulae TaxID=1644114 RepID=UPI00106ED997|nr:hypothetical protein [Brevibacillus migulae]
MENHLQLTWKFRLSLGMALLIGAFAMFTLERPVFTYPAVPFPTSKAEVLKDLKGAEDKLVKLADDARFSWYGMRDLQGQAAVEQVKKHMSMRGWSYEEQNGSGYFFVKDGQKLVITSQKWTREITVFQVPAEARW